MAASPVLPAGKRPAISAFRGASQPAAFAHEPSRPPLISITIGSK